jgi:site-specific recombinase XerD
MTADPTRLALAHQELARLDLTVDDLIEAEARARVMPTFAEYLPRVIAAAGPGAQRTYGTYWNRMLLTWGTRQLDEIIASDIEALQRHTTTNALRRHGERGGRHAGEHLIAAARAIYNRAIADGILTTAQSPAHRVAKPRRLPSTRRALVPSELEDINHAARRSGDDVLLDAMLLRLHTETACRRGGALGLRLQDLDPGKSLVLLREKGGVTRWQPITPTLALQLADHATARGAVLPDDHLLRYRNGAPLTTRRYDHLWYRLGQRLPWVAAQRITTHWLRHTTLTWVERHFGYGIARAYAGHTDSVGPATTTYIKADLQDVATALSAMTGQPHPLAHTDDQRRR